MRPRSDEYAPALPPGVPTNPASLAFDLPAVFREAVDLAAAIRGPHIFESVAGEPDTISF